MCESRAGTNVQRSTADAMTYICLHFLGGSARSWGPLEQCLAQGARCLPVDLPGFGTAASAPGDTVAELADAVADGIRAEAPGVYTLVGHSMGGKVAAAVARRAEDGEAGLEGLSRIVLLAASPPSPEPMDEEQRREMLGWFAGGSHRAEADKYISANVSRKLPAELHALAVEDVLRADPARWRAWLDRGSREDWADRIGVLRTPALIVAGADDPHLGPDGQARLTQPHFATARLVTLAETKHLLPLERTREVAELILDHAP